jgi:hypothetical protein
MVCLDRCHPDSVTDEQVERMLSKVYSRKFLEANCYPADIVLTRRDNGEHEYRRFEWLDAFRAGGLRLVKAQQFVKEVRLALGVKGVLHTLLPLRVRRSLYKTDNASLRTTAKWLLQFLRTPLRQTEFGRPRLAAKETTAFLLRKD